jgi:hypothetical protein
MPKAYSGDMRPRVLADGKLKAGRYHAGGYSAHQPKTVV